MTNFSPGLAPLLLMITACSQQSPAIELKDPWARETGSGQTGGAVYVTLVNRGPDDRLLGAATSGGSKAMLHENRSGDGISRMRMVDSVAIPGGETVILRPGGTHLMLTGGPPMMRGEKFDLRLRFAASGERVARVTVVAAGAR